MRNLLQNTTIKDAESGFFINDRFNGLTYYVGMVSGSAVRLYPIEVPEAEIEIDLSSLTLQDRNGTATTPTDIQERAALLSTYVSKKA